MPLVDFLDNVTTGVAALGDIIVSVGGWFTQVPFVIIPIGAVSILGFKLSMRVWQKLKQG